MATSSGSSSATAPGVSSQPFILTADEGSVQVVPLTNGRYKVTVSPKNPNAAIARTSSETSLPIDIIQGFLAYSFRGLCENLARIDDPEYVIAALRKQLLAYVGKEKFRGKRLLDFGCGFGASTICIGELLPDTEVVGVELDAGRVALAQRVLDAKGLKNVRFIVSPDPNSLPPGIGTFDFVMLSAVYEHLLPQERLEVMPLIWSGMNEGGLLFINQTPYRWFPYEHHTTGLWFINYLPDNVSRFLAQNYTKINPEINRSTDWRELLRRGIRGGTERQILKNLRLSGTGRPTVVQPKSQDRAAYWLSNTSPGRHVFIKKSTAALFRLTDKLFGTVPSINLDVVIRKDPAAS